MTLTMPREETPLAAWLREARQPILVVLVLLVVIALLPCERFATRHLRLPFYGAGRSSNYVVLTAAAVLRALAAGVLVDAFGARRVMALALVAWCVLTTVSGLVVDPRGLALLDLATALVLGVYGIVGWVVIGSRLPRDRALPLSIVFIAGYSFVLAAPFLSSIAVRRVGIDPEATRRHLALFLATIGAFISFVWLVVCPAPVHDSAARPSRRGPVAACDGLVQLLGDRRVWSILVLFVLAEFAFEIGYYRIDRFLAGERGISAFSPYLAGIAGSVIAAVASDRRLASGGSPADARRPFVVAGFLLPVGMALLPILPQDDLIAMACIIGFGLGAQVILSVLVLDIVSPRCLGAFVGIVVAANDLVHLAVHEIVLAVWPRTHSYASILVVGGLASLAGAVVAARSLRVLAPIEIAAT